MIFIIANLYGIDQKLIGKWKMNRHPNAKDAVVEFTKDKIFVEVSMIEQVDPVAASFLTEKRVELYLHDQFFAARSDGNTYWGYEILISFTLLTDDKLLLILYVSSLSSGKEHYNEMTFILTK